jgi:hypothetical protein
VANYGHVGLPRKKLAVVNFTSPEVCARRVVSARLRKSYIAHFPMIVKEENIKMV